MNAIKLFILIMVGWALIAVPALAANVETPAGVPRAVFKSTAYNFATVVDGMTIVHDFIVQNKGSANLKIERVKTG